MKLTNYDRNAFVLAVMQDIPSVDYPAQIAKIVREDAFKQLPKAIQEIVKKGELTHYLDHYHYYPNGSMCTGGIALFNKRGEYQMTPAVAEEVKRLHALHEQQHEQREDMQVKLKAAIAACTTLKAAKERMPEFEKYLPAERGNAGAADLPAVANLVADLAKMGWTAPKPQAAQGA